MRFSFIVLFFLTVGFFGFSQEDTDTDKAELYENYREDQFYLGVTYNILNNKPSGLSQSGFSSGFHFGFIRDMPINKRRNKAIGVGLGLSTNSYNQNMLIENNDGDYSIIDERGISVSKNKFTTYLVELPLEFRWRTSTATEYSFWRIYTGVRFGYVLYSSSKFKSDAGDISTSNISSINKLQYGLSLSTGYGTWNFHLYYGLNTIFEDSTQLQGSNLDLKSIKLGLMFYIL